jgi:hypothetical protein
MKILFIILAIVTAASGISFADTTIIQKVESGAMMGQPATNTVQTMRIKGSKARIDHQNMAQYQIVDLAAKKVYMVDTDKKQVMVMGLDMMNAAGAMFKQMNQNAQMNVQNTGNTRTVNGFKCTDYVVSMSGAMSINSKQCVTTDVDSSDFEAFRPYAEGVMKMFAGDDAATKMPPGISVVSETDMSIMGQKVSSRTELQSVKKEDIPASLFAVPEGFEVKEMPGMPKKQ